MKPPEIPSMFNYIGQICNWKCLTLIDANQHPHKERLITETSSLRQFFVQFWISKRCVSTNILIEYERENGKHGVQCGIADHQETLIESDRRQVEYSRENRLHCRNDETTMNDELGQRRRSFVRSTTVNKEEFGEMCKRWNAEITGQRCLPTFTAFNAHTYY